MTVAITTASARRKRKPKFYRKDWYRKSRTGKGRKKKLKWRAGKGKRNKIRLRKAGRMPSPQVGWGEKKELLGRIQGLIPVRVEHVSELQNLGKENGVIIARVGRKRREELTKIAKEKNLVILNRYRQTKTSEEKK
jgi:ribosomal protein L32E